MELIRIVCDGGGSAGYGNLRRAATLASAFKLRGYRVRVDAESDAGRRLLPSVPGDEGEGDLWLLDIPYAADPWVAAARRVQVPVVALDYQGAALPDLVISVFQRGTAPAHVRHLTGLEYAIISTEISSLAPARPGTGVIVIMGGGDRDGLGEQAALALHAQGSAVTLIEGPLAVSSLSLPPDVVRISAPSDLPARMASCAWGVTSGGGTMLEMLCLGKPVHVLPRTPHEDALARLVFEQGGVLGVGCGTLRPPSVERSARISVTARSLVDGIGAERIIDLVRSLL